MLRPKPGGRCPPSSLPKGPLPGWPFAQGESCPGGPLPREKVTQGALCPGGKLPRGDLSPRAYAFDVWNCEKTLFYLEIHDELWIKVPSVVFPGYDLSSQHSCISSILQRNRQTLEKTTLRSTSKLRSKSYHRVAHWKFGRGSPTSPVTMIHFHCLCEVKSRYEKEAGIYIIWVTFLWRGQLFDRCH